MLHNLDLPVVVRGLANYPAFQPGQLPPAHSGLKLLMEEANLDPENPFGRWIEPGMKVLVKPNWVRHATEGWSTMEALTTHPSLIRPIVDYVARALRTPAGRIEGEIILADSPLQSANLDRLLQQCSMQAILADWKQRSISVQLRDLRRLIADTDESTGVVRSTRVAVGDPSGDTEIDLGDRSRLESLLQYGGRVGVSNYDCATTTIHHGAGIHRYRIANSLLESDVVINLPKWKTHVKTGITGALKNFVGVNCDKAYLPHFRVGSPRVGGDEYPDSLAGVLLARLRPWIERVLPGQVIRTARHSLFSSARRSNMSLIFGGAWPGNDTLWRTIHDMVFIARWLGKSGAKLSSPRPILTVLDAIVAGQGDGPLRPDPRHMGCLVFGTDPGQIDIHAAALSGFNWRSLAVLAHLADPEACEITRLDCTSPLPDPELFLKPPTSWARHLSAEESYCEAA